MTPSQASQKEPRRPRSSQTTVSVSIGEDPRRRRFQFELSECVETKTVTTTTTTKRSFPPVFVREPRPLASLDAKEYPLASKPTPPELSRLTFDVPGLEGLEEDYSSLKQVSIVIAMRLSCCSDSMLITCDAAKEATQRQLHLYRREG
jgi:F-box and WD-40 domain protein CDC4